MPSGRRKGMKRKPKGCLPESGEGQGAERLKAEKEAMGGGFLKEKDGFTISLITGGMG